MHEWADKLAEEGYGSTLHMQTSGGWMGEMMESPMMENKWIDAELKGKQFCTGSAVSALEYGLAAQVYI